MNPSKTVLLPILIFFIFIQAKAQNRDPVDYVNPYIGTDKSSHFTVWESQGATFPGVLRPFGMVQIAPDRYTFQDKTIRSFSFLNHASGYASGGSFQLMASTGPVDSTFWPHPSSFRHATEKTTPYYYSVQLDEDSIRAEFTAAERTGYVRFTFPASSSPHIFLDQLSEIIVQDSMTLTGRTYGGYFIAKFNTPFGSCLAADRSVIEPRISRSLGAILLNFDSSAPRTIEIKLAFSTTSSAHAENNGAMEIPGWDFVQACRDNRKIWNDRLSQVEIKGGTPVQKEIFYTALYHSLFMPHLTSDRGSARNHYVPLYPWDTYRSVHPLLTILDPEREGDMIQSVLDESNRTGWLPTNNMMGNHNIQVLLDAYNKGIRNYDTAKAVKAIRAAMLQAPYARREMNDYVRFGYVPSEITSSVTHTLEYAYDDWAAAEFIKTAGHKTADYNELQLLKQRAYGYQNLYQPDSGFMQAKTASGKWTSGGYAEGTEWTYTWSTQHDVQGLINLMGGPDKFSNKLQECFEQGYYVHDNEPPLHYAYLFDYTGQPWLTQQWARYTVENSYSNDPGGLPGNDDLGTLSSWFALSAMGFYPVTSGVPAYEIGSPLFEEVIIHLTNGRSFTIRANNNSSKNKYIQSAAIDGIPLHRPWFTHEDILKGKTLVFEMGPAPNKTWAAGANAAPFSMTMGAPAFHFGKIVLSNLTLRPDQSAQVSMEVVNKGPAAGTAEWILSDNGKKTQTIHKIVGAGEHTITRFDLRLYSPGTHSITINGSAPQNVVVLNEPPAIRLSDFTSSGQPFVFEEDSCILSAKIKNTGGQSGTFPTGLYVDQKRIQLQLIPLQPGEEKEARFIFTPSSAGSHSISIGNQPAIPIRVLEQHPRQFLDTALLAQLKAVLVLNFEEGPATLVKDHSGYGNNAMVKGPVKWVEGLFGKAIQTNSMQGAYLELPRTPSLEKLNHNPTMTMMCWIYPMEENNFADVIDKMEWHSLQIKGSNSFVNFYTGGWEGHEALADVPAEWNRHWHHLAGVTDGDTLRLYIDGRLAATKKAEPRNPNGETGLSDYSGGPFTIGRNIPNPDRVFKGYIDNVMLFEEPLTWQQINDIMLPADPVKMASD